MNRVRPRWLIAGLTVLTLFGACAGVLADWGFTRHADVWNLIASGAWQAWSVALLGAALSLGVCARRGHGIRHSASQRKRERSVAHVQATLLRRNCNTGPDTTCDHTLLSRRTDGDALATRDARVN